MTTSIPHPSFTPRVKEEVLTPAMEHERLMTDLFGEDASSPFASQKVHQALSMTTVPPPSLSPDPARAGTPVRLLEQKVHNLERRLYEVESGNNELRYDDSRLERSLSHLREGMLIHQERLDNRDQLDDVRGRERDVRDAQVSALQEQLQTSADYSHTLKDLVMTLSSAQDRLISKYYALEQSHRDLVLQVRQLPVRYGPARTRSARSNTSVRAGGRQRRVLPQHPGVTDLCPTNPDTICGAPLGAPAMNRYCRNKWASCRFAAHLQWRREQRLPCRDSQPCPLHPHLLLSHCQRCSSVASTSG